LLPAVTSPMSTVLWLDADSRPQAAPRTCHRAKAAWGAGRGDLSQISLETTFTGGPIVGCDSAGGETSWGAGQEGLPPTRTVHAPVRGGLVVAPNEGDIGAVGNHPVSSHDKKSRSTSRVPRVGDNASHCKLTSLDAIRSKTASAGQRSQAVVSLTLVRLQAESRTFECRAASSVRDSRPQVLVRECVPRHPCSDVRVHGPTQGPLQ